VSAPASADVIVVGAGPAGAVLASYAARAGASVAVLEAGPDPGPWPSPAWPADLIDADTVGTSHDWGYSGPAADGRVLAFPRARVIGGCSSHNGCTQSIGWRGDWDAWGASNPGWASAGLDRHRAHAVKRLRIQQPSVAGLQPFQRAFLDAAVAAGLPHRDDLLDPGGGSGVAISPVNAPGSVRWNSAFAYLDPVRDHPGLTVCANALVDRIEFTGRPGRPGKPGQPGRAAAVLAVIDGRRTRIRAGQVILCAGVYGSAEILLRSGIGPAADLRRLGIPVTSDLPGAGGNLHDHPTAIRSFAAAPALARELDHLPRVPDEQVVAKLSTGQDPAGAPYDLHVFPWTERDPAASAGWRVVVPVALLRPASRGALRLRSADPAVRAHADHAFLADPTDTERLAAGLAALDPILASLPLGEELGEPPSRPAAAWLRRNHEHYWHPAGTCAMGDGPHGVVSEAGTVHGLANVRIADASIFPDVPRATTAFPTVLVAEHMAEMAFGPAPAPQPSAG
jgi:choline dehydrogenase